MIKVLAKGKPPRAMVTCYNCLSTLEYGNEDIKLSGPRLLDNTLYSHYYYFKCPVCGVEVYVDWIKNEYEQFKADTDESKD